jgi:hypothetical protein
MHIRNEVFACTRACENLLASGLALEGDERNLLEYYLRDVVLQYHLTLQSPAPPIIQAEV